MNSVFFSIILLLVALFYSCNSSITSPPTDIGTADFPNKIGDEWKYFYYDSLSHSADTVVVSIIDDTTFNEDRTAKIWEYIFKNRIEKTFSALADYLKKFSDDENNIIFGWGYVALEKDGEQVIDHSGEFTDKEALKDLEIATYGFNIGSRKSGFGHKGLAKGYLAESMFFTKEKLKVLGLSEDALPQGAWLGVWFPDDEDYAKIKKMKAPMFSMEGSAIKEEV